MKNLTLQRVARLALVVVLVAFVAITALRYPTITVPVTSVRVPAGAVLQASQMRMVEFPANAAFKGLVQHAEELVGRTAAVPIEPGTPIVSTMLAGDESVPGLGSDPRFPLARDTDAGKIRFTFKCDLTRCGGGAIKAGDLVDVIESDRSGPGSAFFVLQRVHVLMALTQAGVDLSHYGTPVKPGTTPPPKLSANQFPVAHVILALTSSQALALSDYDWSSLFLQYTPADAPIISDAQTHKDVSRGDLPVGQTPVFDRSVRVVAPNPRGGTDAGSPPVADPTPTPVPALPTLPPYSPAPSVVTGSAAPATPAPLVTPDPTDLPVPSAIAPVATPTPGATTAP